MMVYGCLCLISHFSTQDLVYLIVLNLVIRIDVVDEMMGLSKAHHELCLLRAAVFVHARFSSCCVEDVLPIDACGRRDLMMVYRCVYAISGFLS